MLPESLLQKTVMGASPANAPAGFDEVRGHVGGGPCGKGQRGERTLPLARRAGKWVLPQSSLR